MFDEYDVCFVSVAAHTFSVIYDLVAAPFVPVVQETMNFQIGIDNERGDTHATLQRGTDPNIFSCTRAFWRYATHTRTHTHAPLC